MSTESSDGNFGHNNPPDDEQIMREKLRTDHSDILMLVDQNIRRADELPPEIVDDETDGKYGDVIKKLKGASKMLDTARAGEKEPYLAKGRIVDSFFKARMEKIAEIIKKLDEPHAKYLKAKEDRKRREAEEKARKEKEEADRLLREAQEAERIANEKRLEAERETKRIEAEAEAKRKAADAEAARLRKEAEDEQERIRKKAADDLAEKNAEIARLNKAAADAEERRKKEVLESEEAARQRDADHAAALKKAEDDKRAAEKAAKDAEKQAEEVRKQGERDAKEVEREARNDIRQAETEIRDLNKDVREAERDTRGAMDAAVRQDKVAVKVDRDAMIKGSILSRTRGEASLSSVVEKWVGTVQDRELLDLEALREHIPFAALEQAVQAFVRAGGRQLRGAIIVEETKTAVR